MLTSIEIQSFKSYREAALPLAPLTLLIGANASGKSNAIEAVRFLSWLASGRRLDDLTSAVQGADQSIRGSVLHLPYVGEPAFGLGCHVGGGEWNRFSIRIQVSEEGLRIVDERIEGPGTSVPLYEVTAPASRYSHEIQVAYNNFSRGGRKPRIPCTDQQAVFTQLATPARFGQPMARKVIPRVVEEYRELLATILFLDPSPRQMRGYSFKNERKLKADGENLSSVLYDLCVRQGRKEDLLDFIRALPEQDIRDISFLETPREEVMVRLTESFGGREQLWDAPNLSDGTLRVLAVAAALLSARSGSMVVVEEIDNGVHPSRASLLLEGILRIARESGIRVLLTTHNPALLDALPAEAIPAVVCAYRDPAQGDSRLVRLQDLADYPELVARGPLGQLMTQGILDRFVKNRRTAEEKRRQSLYWLESLKSEVAEG